MVVGLGSNLDSEGVGSSEFFVSGDYSDPYFDCCCRNSIDNLPESDHFLRPSQLFSGNYLDIQVN